MTTTHPGRIQMRRTRGWRKPEGAIYVGRPSRWGNPVKVGDGQFHLSVAGHGQVGFYDPKRTTYYDALLSTVPDAAAATDLYRREMESMLEAGDYDDVVEALEALRGHDLACWCPLDQPCHADVLLEFANRPIEPSPEPSIASKLSRIGAEIRSSRARTGTESTGSRPKAATSAQKGQPKSVATACERHQESVAANREPKVNRP